MKKQVAFVSQGCNLIGHVYYPDNMEPEEQYPAIIVLGSWTTVKEQMAGTYADRLSHQGFIALAFDARGYGESEGEPRNWENPTYKMEDTQAALRFMQSLPEVDESRIALCGISAGAMYALMTAAHDEGVAAVCTVASWLHDVDTIPLLYGGEEGVKQKLRAAHAAKWRYADEGVLETVPKISTTDPNAAMYGSFDYYLNPRRGGIPQWDSAHFAVMSWEDWLHCDPMPLAKDVTVPVIMVHSDGCLLPEQTKQFFHLIASPIKKLVWYDTDIPFPNQQFAFYDQDEVVNYAIYKVSSFLKQHI